MSLRNTGTRLSAMTRELLSKWAETKEQWPDAKSAEFEKNYLADLQSSVDTAVTVIDQLEKVMEKIKKDCE